MQDKAPQVPFEEIKVVFEHDFGETIEETFAEFDEEAIAAASLAQVHKAKLKTGEIVAVKLQFPNLRTQFIADLRFLGVLVSWAD